MVDAVAAATVLVVTVKLAATAPADIVTLPGTLVAAESSASKTETPPDGAALVSLTVPVDAPPPVTLAGLKLSEDSDAGGGGGVTVKVVVRLIPP